MNKQVEKIKAEIERLQDLTMDENKNFKSSYDEGIFDGLSKIESFIGSLQEEPVTSVWHDASEKPLEGGCVLLVLKGGYVTIIRTYCCNDCWIGVKWIKFSEQKQWAYVEDLIKL